MNSIQDQERKASNRWNSWENRWEDQQQRWDRQQHMRTFQQGKQLKKNCKMLEMKSSLCEIKTHWKAWPHESMSGNSWRNTTFTRARKTLEWNQKIHSTDRAEIKTKSTENIIQWNYSRHFPKLGNEMDIQVQKAFRTLTDMTRKLINDIINMSKI